MRELFHRILFAPKGWFVFSLLVLLGSSGWTQTNAGPAPALISFDEGGKTFSKVEGAEVVLTGALTSRALVRKGRWQTPAIPPETFAEGPVASEASVVDARGAKGSARLLVKVSPP